MVGIEDVMRMLGFISNLKLTAPFYISSYNLPYYDFI